MMGTMQRAFAQDRPPLSSEDKHFISEAAEGGLAEVELGHMAADKGESARVKEFGQRMVTDHSQANDKLKDIAQKLGVSVPDHMSATEYAEKTKLKAYSGGHFDRAYMDAMVKDHQDDIAAFRREARDGQNPEIKAFAAKTLPTLEQHLHLAERVNGEITRQASAGGSH
jgi:putative membrane protein